MSRANRLDPVVKITRQQEKNAARAHGESLRQSEQQQKQLDELIEYRNQYLKAFQSAGENGLSAIQMRDYRLFINRLDEAIRQQQQHVVTGKKQCEESESRWMNKRGESKMIEKVVESRKQMENKIADKREQREIEDRPLHNSIDS